MCGRLSELALALGAYASAFDPELVTPQDAAVVAGEAARIESMAAVLKARAAASAADGGGFPGEGRRSAAEVLAKESGSSVAAAKAVLDTGRRLSTQPEVAAAGASGELSFAQAALIAAAVEADPWAADKLLAEARTGTLASLREACAKVQAGAEDLEKRRRRIKAARSLRSWTDPGGTWHLHASGNPEDGAAVMAAIAPHTEAAFKDARREGRREPQDAYAFDGLLGLARSARADDASLPVPYKPPVKLLVRIDYDTFMRGVPEEGETCEIVGYGPVAVSAVHDLVAQGDPFVAAILYRGEALVGVAHLGRKPRAIQRSALEWLYPSCAVEGCAARARLEMDHRIDWSKTHVTMLDLLDLLCHRHHKLKTEEGWALVEGQGKRDFVPPEDPRHPRPTTQIRYPSHGPPGSRDVA